MNSKEREEDQKAAVLDDGRCAAIYHNSPQGRSVETM